MMASAYGNCKRAENRSFWGEWGRGGYWFYFLLRNESETHLYPGDKNLIMETMMDLLLGSAIKELEKFKLTPFLVYSRQRCLLDYLN